MASSFLLRQLDERHLSSPAKLLSWSPTMDLIALVNTQGDVSLHRLSWQKVWTLKPPKEKVVVLSLAWRPDGKVLAVSYTNKCLNLINIENAEVIHSHQLQDSVISLSWVQKSDQSSVDELTDLAKLYLPDLPSFSDIFAPSSKQGNDNLEDPKKLKDLKVLNVLCGGTECGILLFYIFGVFPCGNIDLTKSFPGFSSSEEDCQTSIVNVCMSDDLRSVLAYVSSKIMGCELSGNLKLVTLSTPVFHSHCEELLVLAHQYGGVMALLDYMGQVITSITEAWENVLMEMDSKLANYARSGPPGSVAADFLDLLMFGVPSDELERFLLGDLTKKGLKKLGHSIELSYSNIQKLVLRHLQVVGQLLLFRVGELQGMSEHGSRHDLLGLNPSLLLSALQACGSLLAKATEVQQVIDNSMKNFKAFFRWLYVVMMRLADETVPPEISRITQQDLTFITDFLSQQLGRYDHYSSAPESIPYSLEKLGQYLQDAPLLHPPDTHNIAWNTFLEEHPCLYETGLILHHNTKASLIQQYNAVKRALTAALQEPHKVMSDSFKPLSYINLLERADPFLMKTSFAPGGEGSLYTAMATQAGESKDFALMHFKFPSCESEAPQAYGCRITLSNLQLPLTDSSQHPVQISFPCPPHCNILDLQFYTPDTISLLIKEKGEPPLCYMVQLSIKPGLMDYTKLQPIVCTVPILDNPVLPVLEGNVILSRISYRKLDNITASSFAVSGPRKVAAILFPSNRYIRLYELEVEEEDDVMDSTIASKDSTLEDSQEKDTSYVMSY